MDRRGRAADGGGAGNEKAEKAYTSTSSPPLPPPSPLPLPFLSTNKDNTKTNPLSTFDFFLSCLISIPRFTPMITRSTHTGDPRNRTPPLHLPRPP